MMFKISDSVHGEIFLPSYAYEVISTKEFERLRNIRQLGISYYYFETAHHTRYEHSIGTAYLCGKLLEILERNSDVKIDENHKKCVVLAGLLHDLGHGPYSHLWEDIVRKGQHKNWTHEDQSLKMIHHMMTTNNIMLHSDPTIHDNMMELTCSLITGDLKVWERLLKPCEMFITEIVSNKYCNIDVDKFDYILRDYHCVGRELEPFVELLDRARITFDNENVSHIAYHADDFSLIENLFINRSNYHMDVYQHTKVAGIEKQFKDICLLADSAGFKLLEHSITEIQELCENYSHLDDTILDLIRSDTNESLQEAQELIKQLDCGNFYELIFETKDANDINRAYDNLVKKFGDVFCKVDKNIPNAQVPKNVPLYDDDGKSVQKVSNLDLEYKSTMIFCKAFDNVVTKNARNFLINNNNNDM